MTTKFRFLHFSDVHFQDVPSSHTGEAWAGLNDHVKALVEANGKFDYLVFSGDAFFRGTAGVTLKDKITQLYESAGLALDEGRCPNIAFCPGNHDLNRNHPDRRTQLAAVVGRETGFRDITDPFRLSGVETDVLLQGSFGRFYQAFDDITGRPVYVDKYGGFGLKIGDFPLSFVSVNTAILAGQELSEDEMKQNLMRHKTQREQLEREGQWDEAVKAYKQAAPYEKALYERVPIIEDEGKLIAPTDDLADQLGRDFRANDRIVIAVGHHGRDMFSVRGAAKLDALFRSLKCDLYLCGHVHKPEKLHSLTGHTTQFVCGSMFVDGYSVPSFYEGNIDFEKLKIFMRLHSFASISNSVGSYDPKWALETHFAENGEFMVDILKPILHGTKHASLRRGLQVPFDLEKNYSDFDLTKVLPPNDLMSNREKKG